MIQVVPKDIRCLNCGTLFGKQVDKSLSIKHRDLYRNIDGGVVWGPCRGCGLIVTWPQEKT